MAISFLKASKSHFYWTLETRLDNQFGLTEIFTAIQKIEYNVLLSFSTATKKKVKKNSDSATDSIEVNIASDLTAEKSCDGQNIQLWQFLIELLINKKDFRDIIEWRGTSGEFRFVQPDRVAYLWGLKKNKQNMTFSTLTRALRYYYQSGLIKKLNKQQYSYQFLFDVEFLLGYSLAELDKLC